MVMNEAMPREEWEKMDRGEKIRRSKPIPRGEPVPPKVPDLLKFDDIPLAEFEKIINAKMRRVQNEDKVHFIGYDVIIQLKPKRGPGRPKEGEETVELPSRILKGWLIEGEYEKLKRQR